MRRSMPAAEGGHGTVMPAPGACGKRIGILIVAYNAVTTIAHLLKRIPADVWANVEIGRRLR